MIIKYIVKHSEESISGYMIYKKSYYFDTLEDAIDLHKKLEKESEYRPSSMFEIVVEYDE